ncbi:hypothetical protein P7K49_040139, partial [Saguinus oedipus]
MSSGPRGPLEPGLPWVSARPCPKLQRLGSKEAEAKPHPHPCLEPASTWQTLPPNPAHARAQSVVERVALGTLSMAALSCLPLPGQRLGRHLGKAPSPGPRPTLHPGLSAPLECGNEGYGVQLLGTRASGVGTE